MQVRSTAASTSFIVELTTENGRITLGGATGQVTLNVTASVMSTVPADKYAYDLELVSPTGVVTRLVQGNFVVRAEVTR